MLKINKFSSRDVCGCTNSTTFFNSPAMLMNENSLSHLAQPTDHSPSNSAHAKKQLSWQTFLFMIGIPENMHVHHAQPVPYLLT